MLRIQDIFRKLFPRLLPDSLTELSAPLLPCLLSEVFKGLEVQAIPCRAQVHLVWPACAEAVLNGPWPQKAFPGPAASPLPLSTLFTELIT